jgi:hypothetical protein
VSSLSHQEKDVFREGANRLNTYSLKAHCEFFSFSFSFPLYILLGKAREIIREW